MNKLSREQHHILIEKGTEPAFSGKYHDSKEKGIYRCAQCDAEIFDSKTKFDSGSGWPSFYEPSNENAISTKVDNSLGETRTEVLCKTCKGHLGHVFDDGPETLPDGRQATGKRYCINSGALDLKK